MKKPEQIKPNYAPCYAAAMYPDLAKIFQKHGYALAVHGSLARDFDLIAIPWTNEVSTVEEIIHEMTTYFVLSQIGEPKEREHGRIVYCFSIGWGECV